MKLGITCQSSGQRSDVSRTVSDRFLTTKMDRADLDSIQSKLKLAIRNHQMLVVKMKAEPQNAAMKIKLHELQTEIMSLSEKQKTVVQNLRKELVQKQMIPLSQAMVSQAVSHPLTLTASPASGVLTPSSQVLTSSGQSVTLPLGQTQLVTCNTSLQAQAVILPTTFSVTVPAAHSKLQQTCQAVVVPVSAAVCQPSDLSMCLDPKKTPGSTMITSTPSTQVPIKPALKPLAPRGISPPIKVPQYPLITPGNNKSHGNKSVLVNSKNHMPPPHGAPNRRTSDSEVSKDSRKNVDKKHFKPEMKQKLDFMASLDLVTPEALKELQSKRTERKRRSTANPQFSYNFEPERKRVSHYLLNPPPPGVKRPRGRPPKHGHAPSPNNSRPATPDSPSNGLHFKNNIMRNGSGEIEGHDDFCAVCGKEGELLLCSSCNMVYHLDCLNPPLTVVPPAHWSCPKCQASNKNWAGSAETLALVHSYIATKAAKEEERRKLQKKSSDLANEKVQLEAKSKQLNNSFNEQVERNQHLLNITSEAQLTIEKLKNIIKVVQST